MDTDVTDSAGTLAEPEARAGDEGAGDSGPPADGGGPARPRRRWRWLRWAALATALVLLAAAGTAWWFYRQLDAEITTDTTTAVELRTYERERPRPVVHDARNILVLGSDTRSGENGKYGRDDGTRRADTTILLHIAADRRSATAMSLPRDLMAEIPSCRRDDGSRTTAQFAQFNSAFAIGGAACTIRTVEKMTGIRIDHHVIVDFLGFEKMVDAVDGVEVCLPRPVDDREARLRLDEGKQTLNGEEALGYVRARKSLGDGSDTERMERQQQFLGSLVKKVQSNGVLLNPTRLYPVLKAATSSLTTDPGLDSLKDLYDLTRSLQGIPTEKVQFLTVPRQPWVADINRDELVQPDAGRLFRQLRDDKPVTVVPRGAGDATGPGTGGDGQNAPGTPGAPSAAPGAPSAAPGGPGTPGPVDRADPAGGEGEQNAGSAGKAESGRGGERNPGASPAPSASAESSPTFTGTNAAVGVCE